ALITAGQHCICTGGTRQLAALAGLGFDIVDDRADRHGAERHGIARLHVDGGSRHYGIADGETLRRQDIGLLAIRIFDERDIGGAIGIIFEAFDGRRDICLAALEIDQAIGLLVAAALAARRDPAGIAAPAALDQ